MMKRNSFTLIEILGVVAIIAILATLGFAGYSYANTKSRESATQGLIARLNAAFEMAREKSGFVPPSGGNYAKIEIDRDGNSIKIGDVTYELKANAVRTQKMYSEFYQNFVKTIEMDKMSRFINDNNEVVDAWGNPVYFRNPGILKSGGFDIISAGADGGFGSDAASTPSSDIGKYRDSGEWICDDIANF